MRKQMLFVGIILTLWIIANNEDRKVVDVEYFKKGQMLLPDYACPDTLIVVNAEGLNKGMALIEQGFIDATDYQIDSVLHSNCNIYKQ